jgi:hypothetical protein
MLSLAGHRENFFPQLKIKRLRADTFCKNYVDAVIIMPLNVTLPDGILENANCLKAYIETTRRETFC